MDSKTLVIVGFAGGDASDARSSFAIDTEPGTVRPCEWSALVRADLVTQLAEECGAEIVTGPDAWDGSRFGDGAGTVEIVDGRLVGTGCYRDLTEA